MDVGDQKFISRNSDGRAFITFGATVLLLVMFSGKVNVSSASSLMCDAIDVVDVASRCTPSKLDKNQPRPPFSTDELAPVLLALLATAENVPVK